MSVSIIEILDRSEQVFESTDLALKKARIVYFFGESRGFTDFENTVDRGSAVNLILARIRDCACRILGPKRNLDHRSSSAKLFLFSNEAGVRLFFWSCTVL